MASGVLFCVWLLDNALEFFVVIRDRLDMSKDPYQTLQLTRSAKDSDIKSA